MISGNFAIDGQFDQGGQPLAHDRSHRSAHKSKIKNGQRDRMASDAADSHGDRVIAARFFFRLSQTVFDKLSVSTKSRASIGLIWVNSSSKLSGSAKSKNPLFHRKAIMIIAFGTAIEILLQLIRMDQFRATRTFDPAAKAIFLGRLNFDFWFTARKKTHSKSPFDWKSIIALHTIQNEINSTSIKYKLLKTFLPYFCQLKTCQIDFDKIARKILILKIIGMLPDINGKYGNQPHGAQQIMI